MASPATPRSLEIVSKNLAAVSEAPCSVNPGVPQALIVKNGQLCLYLSYNVIDF